MSDGSIKPPDTPGNSLIPTLNCFKNSKFWVEFYGSCLKADRVFFTPNKIINLYIPF